MKINEQTKISDIIKYNKEAIDVIAAINPHFIKLKNPVLRRVLAPRVTIADAARIGKSSVEAFFNALTKIGFEVAEKGTIHEKAVQDNPLIANCIQSGKVEKLDVRSQLQEGRDPFGDIMEAINILRRGYVLEVINSFEPSPLIRILNKKGYASIVKTEGELVKTFFLKVEEEERSEDKSDDRVFTVSMEKLESEKNKFGDQCKEIDVRGLEMPLPMVNILNELERLPDGYVLYVDHKKVPQYLLPELKDRNFTTWIAEIEKGNVKLLIHH